MNELIYKYMKVGIINLMEFQEKMRGEGTIVEKERKRE